MRRKPDYTWPVVAAVLGGALLLWGLVIGVVVVGQGLARARQQAAERAAQTHRCPVCGQLFLQPEPPGDVLGRGPFCCPHCGATYWLRRGAQ